MDTLSSRLSGSRDIYLPLRAFCNPRFWRFFGNWAPASERIEAYHEQLHAVILAYMLSRRVSIGVGKQGLQNALNGGI